MIISLHIYSSHDTLWTKMRSWMRESSVGCLLLRGICSNWTAFHECNVLIQVASPGWQIKPFIPSFFASLGFLPNEYEKHFALTPCWSRLGFSHRVFYSKGKLWEFGSKRILMYKFYRLKCDNYNYWLHANLTKTFKHKKDFFNPKPWTENNLVM